MPKLRYMSVCSGIEAATVAWHGLGWTPVAFSEIEEFPSKVLKHHYPTVPNHGDMTKFETWPNYATDILVGGTPCQAFSLAGLRKGLDDPRGNLALTFLAMARRYRPRWLVWENVPGVHSSWTDVAVRAPAADGAAREIIDAARRDAGALGISGDDLEALLGGGAFEEADQSSDFDNILAGMVQLGYGCATRVLDAQYFGVAQRRRRVFVVGHLGAWQPAAAVLFEPESRRGDPTPSRGPREGSPAFSPAGFGGYDRGPGTLRASGGDAGRGSELLIAGTPRPDDHVAGTLSCDAGMATGQSSNSAQLVPVVAGTIPAAGKAAGSATGQDAASGLLIPVVAKTLDAKGGTGRHNGADETLVVERARDIAPPVAGTLDRGTPGRGGNGGYLDHLIPVDRPPALPETAPTVTAKWAKGSGGPSGDECQNLVPHRRPLAFNWQSGQGLSVDEEVVPTMIKNQTNAVAFDTTQVTSRENRSNPQPGDPCHPITAEGHPPAVAFKASHFTRGKDGAPSEVAPVLTADGDKGDNDALILQGRGSNVSVGDVSGTLSTNADRASGGAPMTAAGGMGVRRLTPIECERLQGFPDNYTLIPDAESGYVRKGKDREETVAYLMGHGLSLADAEMLADSPDGPRYKALGNSMATTVMEWLGVRIDAVTEAVPWEAPPPPQI